MNLNDIYRYYNDRPRTYLCSEQAICYVLSVLLEDSSYGTELSSKVRAETQQWDISDTVLHQAISFLIDEGWVESERVKVQGRGRPRRMLRLLPQYKTRAEELAQFWLVEAGLSEEWQLSIQQIS